MITAATVPQERRMSVCSCVLPVYGARNSVCPTCRFVWVWPRSACAALRLGSPEVWRQPRKRRWGRRRPRRRARRCRRRRRGRRPGVGGRSPRCCGPVGARGHARSRAEPPLRAQANLKRLRQRGLPPRLREADMMWLEWSFRGRIASARCAGRPMLQARTVQAPRLTDWIRQGGAIAPVKCQGAGGRL